MSLQDYYRKNPPEYFSYKLLKDINFFTYDGNFVVIKKDEVCEFFEHTQVYIFDTREGYAPYYLRYFVENNPDIFEPINA